MSRANKVKANGAVLDAPAEAPPVSQVVEEVMKAPEPEVVSDQPNTATEMQGEASLRQAGRSFLYHQLQKLQKAEPVAREGADPEGVHDMRVATRRLRAALKLLSETVYQPDQTDYFRKRLRKLANALGQTRDYDVFLESLEKYAAQLPETEQAGLEPLRQTLLKRREQGREKMLTVLDSSKTVKLLRKLESFLTAPEDASSTPLNDEHRALPSLVHHFAGSTTWRRFEEVRAYEVAIGSAAPLNVFHQLRIACKRLRYTLDFFEDALPAGSYKALQTKLVSVQDDLGSLHDHQVASELCAALLQDYPDDKALQDYQAYHLTEIEKLKGGFSTVWKTLTGINYRRQLAAGLAGIA